MKSSDLTPYQRLVPLYDPVDLNTLRTPGCYSIFSNQIVNGPFGNAALNQAVVVVERAGGNNLAQVIYDGSGNIYYRTVTGLLVPPLVFFPWRRIIDDTIPLVNHFNGRTGDVVLSSADVTNALGYVPQGVGMILVSSFNGRTGDVTLVGNDVRNALGFWPRNSADALVESFNKRTGAVSLSGGDVTNALGYTPAGMWDTPPNQNLDLLTIGGMYHVDANPVNGPPGLAGQYSQLLVVRGAGGSVWQMLTSMGSANIWYRTGIPSSSPTWDPWRQILDSNTKLVNSFNGRTGAVTLTSGDVTTALGYTPTSLTEVHQNAVGLYTAGSNANLNDYVNSGIYRLDVTPINGPTWATSEFSQLLVFRGGGDTVVQMIVDWTTGNFSYRQGNPPPIGPGNWKPWQYVVSSSNLILQLANPWYIKIPGGLILQGGKLGPFTSGGVFGPYSFGTTFPTTCISLVVSGELSNQVEVTGGTITTSNFKVTISSGNNIYVHWLAAGY